MIKKICVILLSLVLFVNAVFCCKMMNTRSSDSQKSCHTMHTHAGHKMMMDISNASSHMMNGHDTGKAHMMSHQVNMAMSDHEAGPCKLDEGSEEDCLHCRMNKKEFFIALDYSGDVSSIELFVMPDITPASEISIFTTFDVYVPEFAETIPFIQSTYLRC